MVNLACAELMSYTKRFNLWGDVFSYNSVSEYTVDGRISGDANLLSIVPAWSGMSGFIENGLAYQGFVINGVNLGTGKITSFNFEEGNDIQFKKYTMSFEILETGNLYNLTGQQYSEIASSIFDSNFRFFNDFQENINVSINTNGIQETTHSVSFGIEDTLASKNTARNRVFSGFARYRLPNIGTLSVFPNVITGNINSGYINYYNETYDTNDRYSFTKTSRYDNNQKATWTYSHSFDYNSQDIVMTENGIINSIYFVGANEIYKNLSGARDRWSDISTGIYSRLVETFNAVTGLTGVIINNSSCPLIDLPLDKRWQENPFEGIIEYSYSYSNNPIYNSSGFIFSNSRQVSVDENGYYQISENGNYQGVSPNKSGRFTQASGAYYSGNSSITSRITGTFILASGLNENVCVGSGVFKLINDSITFEEFDGRISYSNTYSNSPNYYTGNSNFIKYTTTIDDKKPVHLNNKFLVPFVGEIAQSADQSTEGSYTNRVEIFGKTGVSLDSYLTEAYSRVVKPSGSGVFLREMRYSFNPFENSFVANFDYSYSKYRTRNDIFV